MNKFRIACILLLALICTGAAFAEDLPAEMLEMLPAGAQLEQARTIGSFCAAIVVLPDTGEKILLSYDLKNECMLSEETQQPAAQAENAQAVERAAVEEVVKAAYPGCRILFAEDAEGGKRLGVAGDSFCGTVVASNERIVSRSLQYGEICKEGMLTLTGALRIMELHRPDAQFIVLELDEDDGIYVYEGEALLDGEAYEFELDISTGKLLEWERD